MQSGLDNGVKEMQIYIGEKLWWDGTVCRSSGRKDRTDHTDASIAATIERQVSGGNTLANQPQPGGAAVSNDPDPARIPRLEPSVKMSAGPRQEARVVQPDTSGGGGDSEMTPPGGPAAPGPTVPPPKQKKGRRAGRPNAPALAAITETASIVPPEQAGSLTPVLSRRVASSPRPATSTLCDSLDSLSHFKGHNRARLDYAEAIDCDAASPTSRRPRGALGDQLDAVSQTVRP